MAETITSAPVKTKSVGVAYALWFFLGVIGVHQFYLGNTIRAVTYIFTLGWLGIGLLIDLFTIPSQVRKANGEA
ncbi:TM2 domain-containing protein [Luedemannella helvata]|uniref:TM2 domain-containing protein n=1 Tax=Luedemannella helvata TaxID=349315 RepID=A0ABP4VVR5_9ACTN